MTKRYSKTTKKFALLYMIIRAVLSVAATILSILFDGKQFVTACICLYVFWGLELLYAFFPTLFIRFLHSNYADICLNTTMFIYKGIVSVCFLVNIGLCHATVFPQNVLVLISVISTAWIGVVFMLEKSRNTGG